MQCDILVKHTYQINYPCLSIEYIYHHITQGYLTLSFFSSRCAIRQRTYSNADSSGVVVVIGVGVCVVVGVVVGVVVVNFKGGRAILRNASVTSLG